MFVVSYFLRQSDLQGVDTIGLYKTLRALGYRVLIGNQLMKVEALVKKFESKEHIYKEMIIDIESLLKRFKIKK